MLTWTTKWRDFSNPLSCEDLKATLRVLKKFILVLWISSRTYLDHLLPRNSKISSNISQIVIMEPPCCLVTSLNALLYRHAMHACQAFIAYRVGLFQLYASIFSFFVCFLSVSTVCALCCLCTCVVFLVCVHCLFPLHDVLTPTEK